MAVHWLYILSKWRSSQYILNLSSWEIRPEKVQIYDFHVFLSHTDYTLESEECLSKNGLWKAETGILKQLKDDIQTGKHLRTTTRFYFRLPLSTAHKVHPVGEAATVAHSIHLKITSKICELVSENITSPDVVWKCSEQYVDKEMFGSHEGHQKSQKSNGRYYLSHQDLQSHIAPANTVVITKSH